MKPSDYWIQTYTGHQFRILEPDPETIHIIDIAHALSNLCRFAGHCSEFYSVAQHSVLVSHIVSPENAMWGLMHDASEAYICDITKPLKLIPEMAPYRKIEQNIMKTICRSIGLPEQMPEEIKTADLLAMRTEARDLKLFSEQWDIAGIEPLDFAIVPTQPIKAEQDFIARFVEIIHQKTKHKIS